MTNATTDVHGRSLSGGNLTRSSLAYRRLAYERLEAVTVTGGPHESHVKERWLRQLNGTFAAYRDANRTNTGALFQTDTRVAAAMQGRAPNVTSAIIASDAVLAHTSVRDAERVVSVLRDRNVTFDVAAVQEQIVKATRALQRGDRLRSRSVGAIQQYRRAWGHAQRALDIMDEAVVPTVTITTRRDIPHNTTLVHAVNGTIFDVRSYELNVTLSVNGTTRNLSLDASTAPGHVAQFNTSVQLARQWPLAESARVRNRTYEIGVSARDPGTDYARTTSRRFTDIHKRQRGLDLVHLDGDGLPDVYEQSITETDRLDADSDSARTGVAEANDGIIDGIEDFDNESIITYREYREGLDPFDPDTDGDNLTDAFELEYFQLDPLATDTDADGVPDGAEDFDTDGLTNIEEAQAETNPNVADTDGDKLPDSELVDYGTSPTNTDTDSDGLTDYEEVELGIDPLVADTDGDGVVDGNETYRSTATNDDTGVSVAIWGEGLLAEQVTMVDRPSYFNETAASAGPTVSVYTHATFERATVTIPIDESVDLSEQDLSIYRWDPGSHRPWQPIETEIDTPTRTASTTVTSFAYFTVLDKDVWQAEITAEAPTGWPYTEDFDDLSGWDCSGTCQIVDGHVVIGRVATVHSTDTISIFRLPFCDVSPGPGCIPRDDSGGSDDGSDGSDGSTDDGTDDDVNGGSGSDDGTTDDGTGDSGGSDGDGDTGNHDGSTDGGTDDGGTSGSDDGQTSDGPDLRRHTYVRTETFDGEFEDLTLKTTVSVGPSDVDSTGVLVIRGDTGRERRVTLESGSFVFETVDISTFDDQTVTFKYVSPKGGSIGLRSFEIIRDADGDGLLDWMEQRSWRFPFADGDVIQTSRTDPDTDGDGIVDGVEISITDKLRRGQYLIGRALANPTKRNTDGAGLPDGQELTTDASVFIAESITVAAKVPTRAKLSSNGAITPIKKSAGRRNNLQDEYWEMIPKDKFQNVWYNKLLGRPNWIEGYNLDSGETYHRIPVLVFVGANTYVRNNIESYRDDLPPIARVRLPTSAPRILNTEIVKDGIRLQPGLNEGYIIVEETDRWESFFGSEVAHLGKLHLQITFPEESIFLRSDKQLQDVPATVDGRTIDQPSTARYGTAFSINEDYRLALGGAAEALTYAGLSFTALGLAQTTVAIYGASSSLAIAVSAASFEAAATRFSGGTAILKRQFIGSTSFFMSAEEYREIVNSETETFIAFSGPDMTIAT